jgi:hypothetical protein
MKPSSLLLAWAYALDMAMLTLEDIAHKLDRAGI